MGGIAGLLAEKVNMTPFEWIIIKAGLEARAQMNAQLIDMES